MIITLKCNTLLTTSKNQVVSISNIFNLTMFYACKFCLRGIKMKMVYLGCKGHQKGQKCNGTLAKS